jgi:hypothetical protein
MKGNPETNCGLPLQMNAGQSGPPFRFGSRTSIPFAARARSDRRILSRPIEVFDRNAIHCAVLVLRDEDPVPASLARPDDSGGSGLK